MWLDERRSFVCRGDPSQLGILFGMRKAEIIGDPLD